MPDTADNTSSPQTDTVSPTVSRLIAQIDRSAGQLRDSNISGREFRDLAVARRRREAQAWVPIRSAARLRGAR